MGARTATILTADFSTGNLLMEAFQEEFERLGGTVVQFQSEPFVVDFAPYLNVLETADVMVAWPIGTGAQFISQYAERGLFDEMPIITPILSGMSDPFIATYQELGDIILGIKGLDTYCADYDWPTNNAFVDAYTQAYGGYPDASLIGAGAYGIYIILQTFEAMGGSTDPDLFMETLLSQEYDTPSGIISFDPDTKWATMNLFMMDTVLKDGVCQPELLEVYRVSYPPVKP
jgi:branched-chain amino acid transport system substrate-binding protein